MSSTAWLSTSRQVTTRCCRSCARHCTCARRRRPASRGANSRPSRASSAGLPAMNPAASKLVMLQVRYRGTASGPMVQALCARREPHKPRGVLCDLVRGQVLTWATDWPTIRSTTLLTADAESVARKSACSRLLPTRILFLISGFVCFTKRQRTQRRLSSQPTALLALLSSNQPIIAGNPRI